MTSAEKFIVFMRRLTGRSPEVHCGLRAFSWRIHGVLVTYWSTAGIVKIYQHLAYRNNVIDDTSKNSYTMTWFHYQQESCREHLCNLTWRHHRP